MENNCNSQGSSQRNMGVDWDIWEPDSPRSWAAPQTARKGGRGKLTYQKQGYRSAQDEARDHIGAVVPVFRDPVEARQEGHAEGPEAQHGLGQSAALRLDCACDVHLEQDRDGE